MIEHLHLRKRRAAVDLVDANGQLATLFRESRDDNKRLRFDALYLRKDLLESYLGYMGKQLLWINWGERKFNYKFAEKYRHDPEVQAVWGTHAHIHKKLVVYPVSL